MHKKRSRVSVINLSTVIQTWSQPDNFHQILSDWRRLKFNKHSLHKAGISLWDRLIWRYSTATQIWIVLKVFIIVDHDLLLLGFLYQGTLDIPSCRIYYLSKFHVLLWKKKKNIYSEIIYTWCHPTNFIYLSLVTYSKYFFFTTAYDVTARRKTENVFK